MKFMNKVTSAVPVNNTPSSSLSSSVIPRNNAFKTNVININVGQANSGASSYDKNKIDQKGYSSLAQLEKYLKLKESSRNLALYIFIDRYSILFSSRILPGCNYTPRRYEIVENGSESGLYLYATAHITNRNEEHVTNYMQMLRQLVGFNSVPNLALMHRHALYFMTEVTTSLLNNQKFSKKNARDIIFQVLFALSVFYSIDMYIFGFGVSVVILPEPVTLIYKYGNIIFTLNEVIVVPILFPQNSDTFRVLKFTATDAQKLESYNGIASSLRSLLGEDNPLPTITDANYLRESILAYIILEYDTESNLCTFEVTPEDARVTNKYASRHCLLNSIPIERGTVYSNPADRSIQIRLSANLFLSLYMAEIAGMNVNDLDRMLSVKETKTQFNFSKTAIKTFTINGI